MYNPPSSTTEPCHYRWPRQSTLQSSSFTSFPLLSTITFQPPVTRNLSDPVISLRLLSVVLPLPKPKSESKYPAYSNKRQPPNLDFPRTHKPRHSPTPLSCTSLLAARRGANLTGDHNASHAHLQTALKPTLRMVLSLMLDERGSGCGDVVRRQSGMCEWR